MDNIEVAKIQEKSARSTRAHTPPRNYEAGGYCWVQLYPATFLAASSSALPPAPSSSPPSAPIIHGVVPLSAPGVAQIAPTQPAWTSAASLAQTPPAAEMQYTAPFANPPATLPRSAPITPAEVAPPGNCFCPCSCCAAVCWAITGMLALAVSGVCWLFVFARSSQLANVCDWWLPAMIVLFALCFAGPIFAAFACLCGGVLAPRKSRPKPKPKHVGTAARAAQCVFGAMIILSVLVMVTLAGALAYLTTGQEIPLHVPVLKSPITIEYDVLGVPHIKAENLHDACVGIGLVHARDRLWQLEFQRRTATGTLSEVLGIQSLDADKQMRLLGLREAAERARDALDDETREALDAYAAGVNAYLSSDPHLPLEFLALGFRPAPWDAVDSLAWEKVVGFMLSTDLDAMLTRWGFLTEQGITYERAMQLYPPYNRSWEITALSLDEMEVPLGIAEPASERDAPELIDFLNGFRNVAAPAPRVAPYDFLPLRHGPSNNFAVSGAHTGSGPLLANDPHLRFSSPAVWYALHVEAGDTKAIGVGFPGLPGVVVGRTAKTAWGVTTTAVDVQDLYLLELSPDGGYVYDGKALPFREREEVIPIKNSDPYVMTVRLTQDWMPVLGPPLLAEGSPPLALKWPLIDPAVADTTAASLLGLMRAATWAEFKQSLELFVGPVHNFVFASTTGDIAYIMPGYLPQRRKGVTGMWPVPGNSSDYAWKAPISPALWPQTLNPPKGFVATANNQITPAGYERAGYNMNGEYLPHYRAQRITDMLTALLDSGRQLTVGDLRDIQLDVLSYQFRDLVPVLQALPASGLSPLAAEWRGKLLAWNGETAAGSPEPTVYAAWVLELQRMDQNETGMTQWGGWATAWLHVRAALLGLEEDPGCLGSCPMFAATALNTAVERVTPGKKWGIDVHRAVFDHYVMSSGPSYLACAFDRTAQHGGDGNTVCAGAVTDSDTMESLVGPSYRQIVDLGAMEANSAYMLPPGQSGQPLSAHYDDQLEMFSSGDYAPMRMIGYEVEQAMVITP